MNKLELSHVDTCLPDYWPGHSLPHLSIPVFNGMTLKQIKESLHSELNQDAIAGGDREVTESEEWHRKAKAAINRIKPVIKGQRRFFTDLEEEEEEDFPVYAYFVFVEED